MVPQNPHFQGWRWHLETSARPRSCCGWTLLKWNPWTQTPACDSTYSSALPTMVISMPVLFFYWQSEVPEGQRSSGVQLEDFDEVEQNQLEAAAESQPGLKSPRQELHSWKVPFPDQQIWGRVDLTRLIKGREQWSSVDWVGLVILSFSGFQVFMF